jgi:hypothetical protein
LGNAGERVGTGRAEKKRAGVFAGEVRKAGRWGIPKIGIESDETAAGDDGIAEAVKFARKIRPKARGILGDKACEPLFELLHHHSFQNFFNPQNVTFAVSKS